MRLAQEQGEVHALHRIPDDLLPDYSTMTNGSVHWQPLDVYRERALASMLRNSLAYAQYFWVDNYPMKVKRRIPPNCSFARRTMMNTAKAVGRFSASPRGIQRLDRIHSRVAGRLPEVAGYREQFQKIKPNVLFCSHQRPVEILAPVLAARSLGIPTATFIFSWDNLSSKARIAAPFDHYLVWSELMRDELMQYYPDVQPEQIHVVGTPQFDPYADESLLWTREEFFRRVGADPHRKLICYSGGECLNAVEDHLHIRVLMELVRDGSIQGNPQVLMRTCPIDEFSRYDSVREDYPEMIYRQPQWSTSSFKHWAASIPTASDVQMLANLTKHSDLNVNFSSTMTLDFAIHDVPVVNVAIDMSDPPVFGLSMYDYLNQFEHYLPVEAMGAARYARTREELAKHVNAYLQDPTLDRQGRQAFVDLEVGVPMGKSSRSVVESLKKIAR